MTVEVVAEVTTLAAPTWNGSQWVRTFGSTENVDAGDSLLVLVGGGNHVTGYPGGWDVLDDQSGQEAQGFVMARTFATDQGTPSYTVAFDGTDTALVSVIHVRGDGVLWELDAAIRSGAVGVPQSAGSVPVTGSDTGDLMYYFGFARNSAGDYPEVPGATLVDGLSLGSEGGSLHRSTPTDDTGAVFDLPGRTGHYLVALAVYVLQPGPWRDDAETVWQSTVDTNEWQWQDGLNPDPEANRLLASQDVWGGLDVSWDNATRLDSSRLEYIYQEAGENGWFVSWLVGFHNLERVTSVWDFTGSTGTPPADVVDPVGGEVIAPGASDIEWSPDPGPALSQRAVADVSLLDVIAGPASTILESTRTYKLYALIGTVGDIGTTELVTGQDAADDAAFNGAWLGDASWDLIHPGGDLSQHPASLINDIPGDPNAPLRVWVVGMDEAAVLNNALSYTGTDNDGLILHYVGRLEQEYRPKYRLLYRHPPATPTTFVRYLRNYPRDDQYGFGGTGRNYPPPRGLRNVGGQP